MKTNKIITLVIAFITTINFTSCVEDGDFEIPNSLGAKESLALQSLLNNNSYSEISVTNLKGLFVNGQATEITSDIYVKGYVTSSDFSGNFYKEFFIQDEANNPTAAIKVVLELTDSYNKFNVGREVYINLKGLYIGEVRSGDGVVAIGGKMNSDDEVENLSLNQVNDHILRSSKTEELMPLVVKFSEINDSHVGLYVKIENAQFPADLAGKTYVDANDRFDTQRLLESCEGFGYTNFILETSAFADFKFQTLPAGGGSIAAVVSKTFNGSDLVLALNKVSDVKMDGAKCDPLVSFFSEDFQSAVDNSDLDFSGWTNFAETGRELWTEQVFSGNGYTEFSAFRTGDAVNIGWLVSPSINMDAQENEVLNFKVAQHHLDNDVDNKLELFVSTDYDGTNVLSATWQPLSFNVPKKDDRWYAFQDSGLIDLSSYTGTLFVAFKYTGSGTNTDLDGAYMIDDFVVGSK